MIYDNTLRQRLIKGDIVQAAWLFSRDSDTAEILARAGYPVVIVDHEHGTGDLASLAHVLRAVRIGGAEPLLRVPSHDPDHLKRVLDAGVRTLMVPLVETAEQAEAIVAACRYPPKGRRGYAAGVVRASAFGMRPEYGANAAGELFIAVQIESARGLANARAIAAVDGVDMVFIGPNDLAGNLGFFERLDEKKVHEAVDMIAAAVTSTGKALGIIPYGDRSAGDLARLGFALIATAADYALLRDSAKADCAAFTKAVTK